MIVETNDDTNTHTIPLYFSVCSSAGLKIAHTSVGYISRLSFVHLLFLADGTPLGRLFSCFDVPWVLVSLLFEESKSFSERVETFKSSYTTCSSAVSVELSIDLNLGDLYCGDVTHHCGPVLHLTYVPPFRSSYDNGLTSFSAKVEFLSVRLVFSTAELGFFTGIITVVPGSILTIFCSWMAQKEEELPMKFSLS